MKIMSLDLELNQPSGRVIQVGACVYDRKKEEVVATLSLFVNPQEPIAERITELTGITNDDVVMNGYPVKDAYFLLKKFAKKHKVTKNPLVWGSGEWNDSACLYKEANPEEPNFMGHRVLDVKTLYQFYRIENSLTMKGGLDTATKELGIPFKGKNHNALDDAINTAYVYRELTKMLKSDQHFLQQEDL